MEEGVAAVLVLGVGEGVVEVEEGLLVEVGGFVVFGVAEGGVALVFKVFGVVKLFGGGTVIDFPFLSAIMGAGYLGEVWVRFDELLHFDLLCRLGLGAIGGVEVVAELVVVKGVFEFGVEGGLVGELLISGMRGRNCSFLQFNFWGKIFKNKLRHVVSLLI